MTDIRKECMEAYKKAFKEYERDWSDDDIPLMLEEIDAYKSGFADGFQAGRAHDIEGLIAALFEACEGNSTTLRIDYAISIIRKHFGKE